MMNELQQFLYEKLNELNSRGIEVSGVIVSKDTLKVLEEKDNGFKPLVRNTSIRTIFGVKVGVV